MPRSAGRTRIDGHGATVVVREEVDDGPYGFYRHMTLGMVVSVMTSFFFRLCAEHGNPLKFLYKRDRYRRYRAGESGSTGIFEYILHESNVRLETVGVLAISFVFYQIWSAVMGHILRNDERNPRAPGRSDEDGEDYGQRAPFRFQTVELRGLVVDGRYTGAQELDDNERREAIMRMRRVLRDVVTTLPPRRAEEVGPDGDAGENALRRHPAAQNLGRNVMPESVVLVRESDSDSNTTLTDSGDENGFGSDSETETDSGSGTEYEYIVNHPRRPSATERSSHASYSDSEVTYRNQGYPEVMRGYRADRSSSVVDAPSGTTDIGGRVVGSSRSSPDNRSGGGDETP